MKKKLFAILIMLSIFVASIPINAAESSSSIEQDTDAVLEYLLDAGYPQEIIDMMDETAKLKFFEDRQTYESSDISYGVMTEDFHITYQIDNDGEILIDNENLTQLDELVKEKSAVEKILNDKNEAILSEGDTLQSQSLQAQLASTADMESQQVAEDTPDASTSILTDKQIQFIDNIEEQEPKAVLAALSNWTSNIIVSRISSSTKSLSYSWQWNYDPYINDIDKMALAWSGGYSLIPSSVSWRYMVYASKYEYVFTPLSDSPGYWRMTGPSGEKTIATGYGYNEMSSSCGVSKDVDIVEECDTVPYQTTWMVSKHIGYLYAEIRNYGPATSSGEVIGRYYHHTSTGSPGSLSFTSLPAITMYGGSYDPSPTKRVPISFYK